MEILEEIKKIKTLLDQGAITEEEFEELKKQLLAKTKEESALPPKKQHKDNIQTFNKPKKDKKKSRSWTLRIIGIILVGCAFSAFLFFNGGVAINKKGVATDQEGNTFKTIKIGKQIWMAENLNVSTYKNGEPILEANRVRNWQSASRWSKPAWCYYDENPSNGDEYGKLYNWFAANDERGIAPEGWHIPTIEEVETLKKYLDRRSLTSKPGKSIASTSGWNTDPKPGCVGHEQSTNNRRGFSGRPGGLRYGTGEFANSKGSWAIWWTTTDQSNEAADRFFIISTASYIASGAERKQVGLAIRCIKD